MIRITVDYLKDGVWYPFPDVLDGTVSIRTGFSNNPLFENVADTGVLSFSCKGEGAWEDFHSKQDNYMLPVRVIARREYGDMRALFYGYIFDVDISLTSGMVIYNYTAYDWLEIAANKTLSETQIFYNVSVSEYIKNITNGILVDVNPDKRFSVLGDLSSSDKTIVQEIKNIAQSANLMFFLRYTPDGFILTGRPSYKDFQSKYKTYALGSEEVQPLETENGQTLQEENGDTILCNERTSYRVAVPDPILVSRFQINKVDVYNKSQYELYERRDYGTYVSLYKLSRPVVVSPNSQYSFRCDYRVDGIEERIVCTQFLNEGSAGNGYLFLPQNYYTVNTTEDGTGNDLKPYVSVLFKPGGRDAEVLIMNKSAQTAYVTSLEIVGRPLIIQSTISEPVINQASVIKYGEKSRTFGMPYGEQKLDGMLISNYLVTNHSNAFTYVGKATILSKGTASEMALIDWEIGDVIYTNVTQADIKTIRIHAIEYRNTHAGNIEMSCSFHPAGIGASATTILSVNRTISGYDAIAPSSCSILFGIDNTGIPSIAKILEINGGEFIKASIYFGRVNVEIKKADSNQVTTYVVSSTPLPSGIHTVLYTNNDIYIDGVKATESLTSSTSPAPYVGNPSYLYMNNIDGKVTRLIIYKGNVSVPYPSSEDDKKIEFYAQHQPEIPIVQKYGYNIYYDAIRFFKLSQE